MGFLCVIYLLEKVTLYKNNCVVEVVGRGRGIMGTVDPTLKLPKGRGYAPPGMGKGEHFTVIGQALKSEL